MTESRRRWRRVDGVVLLDKPQGPSSNAALQRVRRVWSAEKGGHGGTLDPMASGLLPIAFGEATKFLHDLLDADKTYEAVLTLGVVTDTGDAEGMELARQSASASDDAIATACAAFVGRIEQLPPMHSALKHAGRPLYDYARAGQQVDRSPRPVTVHAIDLYGIDRSQPGHPRVSLRAQVSKGTYIRSLAMDIGQRLGCGAHLSALRRTQVGSLSINQAVTLDWLEHDGLQDPQALAARLLPVDSLVDSLPRVGLPEGLATRFLQGQRLVLDGVVRAPLASVPGGPVRVYRGEDLLGIAEFDPPGLLAPRRVLCTVPAHT